jgi:secondary thiamine-phosphate synthase enzyme
MSYYAIARPTETSQTSAYHRLLYLRTHACLELIDLTDILWKVVQESGIKKGFVNIQTKHTTTAILINENEPLLLADIQDALEKLVPQNHPYRHDDFKIRTVNLTPDEKPNGHSHCKALFLRASETINLVDSTLQLGPWQRIFFVELDRARNREVSVMILGV